MSRATNPTVSRRQLAARLRELRSESGKTLGEVSRLLEISVATLSRMETGVRLPRARDVRDLCVIYDVTNSSLVDHLVGLVAKAKEPGWWEKYEVDEEYATLIALEDAATSIEQYDGTVVPGLLQVPPYMQAYLVEAVSPGLEVPFTTAEVDERIAIRKDRQARLFGPSSTVTYEAFIDEGVLRRPVGGAGVMQTQLAHLVRMSELHTVTIRVVPFDIGAHPAQPGGFIVLTLPPETGADVVYVDSLIGQIFMETDEDLVRHRRVLAKLREVALGEDESRACMHTMAEVFAGQV